MTEKRTDMDTRDRVEKIHEGYDRVSRLLMGALAVFGIMVTAALITGAIALHRVGSEADRRINDIQESRIFATASLCVADSDKNGVIQGFILFSVEGRKNSPLYVRARRVFPVKDRAACIRDAKIRVRTR